MIITHRVWRVILVAVLLQWSCSEKSTTDPDPPEEPPQPVLYVRADAPAGGDGRSWATAFSHPQEALDAASAGDHVWVAGGTYERRTGEANVITMKASVAIFGGFAGTETAREERSWTANATVLDGGQSGRVVIGASQSRLDGFEVVNAGFGGMVNGDVSGLVVRNCTFRNNIGSAITNVGSSPTITSCRFVMNGAESTAGGAIENLSGSSPVIRDCLFEGNVALMGGAIASNDNSAPEIRNCQFRNNTAIDDGSGGLAGGGGAILSNLQSNAVIVNCLFVGNTGRQGGAIHNSGSILQFINSTFSANRAEFGGAIYGQTPTTFVNCILWGDSATFSPEISGGLSNTVSFSNVAQTGGFQNGGNNIDTPPRFVDAAGVVFRLQPGSPCIDAGSSADAPEDDLDGNPRPAGAACDMGAYEYQTPPGGNRIRVPSRHGATAISSCCQRADYTGNSTGIAVGVRGSFTHNAADSAPAGVAASPIPLSIAAAAPAVGGWPPEPDTFLTMSMDIPL